MKHVLELLNVVHGTVGSVATSDVVVGAPIELGGVTLVPLSSVSVGAGGGGGTGEGEAPQSKRRKSPSGEGTGGGVGGGGKVRPVAVAVFKDDGVEILPVPHKAGPVEKLLDRIPDLVGKVRDIVEKVEE